MAPAAGKSECCDATTANRLIGTNATASTAASTTLAIAVCKCCQCNSRSGFQSAERGWPETLFSAWGFERSRRSIQTDANGSENHRDATIQYEQTKHKSFVNVYQPGCTVLSAFATVKIHSATAAADAATTTLAATTTATTTTTSMAAAATATMATAATTATATTTTTI